MIFTTALISALAPAAVDAVKTLFGGLSRKIGGLSVEDEIKLMEANTARLVGLAQLDNPYGTPTQWVVDLRASFRYVAAGICVVGGFASMVIAPTFAPIALEIASSAFGFIFGDRMNMALKGK